MSQDTAPPFAPAPLSATRWQLRLLGAVELHDAKGQLVRLPTRAVVLLLARLGLAPQRQHAREELIDQLWPGAEESAGRNRLRQALSVLRSILDDKALAPLLHADRRVVWLAPDAFQCDVQTFEQALRGGNLRQAELSYGGELMPGYNDEWVIEERHRLASLADQLLPLPAAQANDSDPPVAAPAAGLALRDAQLPSYLTRLVGFEADGAALCAALRVHRLVVLRGPGGAGKTRLAVEVARALSHGRGWRHSGTGANITAQRRPLDAADAVEPFDLIAFVPLAACASREQMLDAVLRVVQEDSDAGSGTESERLERALAGRRVLLLLDNFEQLVEEARADLAHWLARLTGLHLLVTSRRSLGLDGEVEHALAALMLPGLNEALQAHLLNPAVILFVERARAARAGFALTAGNHEQVAAIARALHGLPLAIELAAARVRSLALAEILQMLDGSKPGSMPLELLERSGPRAADDERHASMLSVLQWSWQHLSPAEQGLLALLSVCDGGASRLLLARLAGSSATAGERSEFGLPAAALGVDGLLSASVAYRQEGPDGASRFHAFEPMREFVLRQAGPAGVAQLRGAHARALAAWVLALGPDPAPQLIRSETPNLWRALASGADLALSEASPEQAIDTVLTARAMLSDLQPPPSALALLRQAAAAAPGHRHAELQARLALYSYLSGERDHAQQHVQLTLAAAFAAPEPEAEALADVWCCVASVQLRLGADIQEVLALSERALALARRHQLRDVEARALSVQAVSLMRLDHDVVANERRRRQLLALWRAHGPRARVTEGLAGLALALGFLHRTPEQLEVLDEARALAAELGQTRLLAFTQSITGYALADRRRFEASAAMYRLCLQGAWAQGHWREWFYALWNLPRTLAHLRQPEAAAKLMGFAERFYAERFGVLGSEDLFESRRTRRLIAVQIGRERAALAWHEGQELAMAEAMRLAVL